MQIFIPYIWRFQANLMHKSIYSSLCIRLAWNRHIWGMNICMRDGWIRDKVLSRPVMAVCIVVCSILSLACIEICLKLESVLPSLHVLEAHSFPNPLFHPLLAVSPTYLQILPTCTLRLIPPSSVTHTAYSCYTHIRRSLYPLPYCLLASHIISVLVD